MRLTDARIALVDFDGTLLDSEGCWLEAYTLACEKISVAPLAKIIDAFGQLCFGKWQALIKKQHGISDTQITECAKEVYSRRPPKASVLAILNSIPEGCSRSIVTKEPSELVKHWLQRYNVSGFDNIITSANERAEAEYYRKPFLLLIDDNYRHCKAAKEAGALVIGINDHHSNERKMQMKELCDLYLEE